MKGGFLLTPACCSSNGSLFLVRWKVLERSLWPVTSALTACLTSWSTSLSTTDSASTSSALVSAPFVTFYKLIFVLGASTKPILEAASSLSNSFSSVRCSKSQFQTRVWLLASYGCARMVVLKPEHPVVCLRFTTFHSRASITWGEGIWSSFIIRLRSDIPKKEPSLWWRVGSKKEAFSRFCDPGFCGFMAVFFSLWAKCETRCQISFGDRFFSAKKLANKTQNRLSILQNQMTRW